MLKWILIGSFILNKAMEIGIKAAGRYFDIQPSQVRYYIRKVEQSK